MPETFGNTGYVFQAVAIASAINTAVAPKRILKSKSIWSEVDKLFPASTTWRPAAPVAACFADFTNNVAEYAVKPQAQRLRADDNGTASEMLEGLEEILLDYAILEDMEAILLCPASALSLMAQQLGPAETAATDNINTTLLDTCDVDCTTHARGSLAAAAADSPSMPSTPAQSAAFPRMGCNTRQCLSVERASSPSNSDCSGSSVGGNDDEDLHVLFCLESDSGCSSEDDAPAPARGTERGSSAFNTAGVSRKLFENSDAAVKELCSSAEEVGDVCVASSLDSRTSAARMCLDGLDGLLSLKASELAAQAQELEELEGMVSARRSDFAVACHGPQQAYFTDSELGWMQKTAEAAGARACGRSDEEGGEMCVQFSATIGGHWAERGELLAGAMAVVASVVEAVAAVPELSACSGSGTPEEIARCISERWALMEARDCLLAQQAGAIQALREVERGMQVLLQQEEGIWATFTLLRQQDPEVAQAMQEHLVGEEERVKQGSIDGAEVEVVQAMLETIMEEEEEGEEEEEEEESASQ